MPVFLNGGAFRKASFNGNRLRRIYCNGVLVWRSIPEYLYSAGDEAADVTGGWTTGSLWTGSFAEKRPDGFRLVGKGSGAGATGNDNVTGAGWAYTANQVDLTDISRLRMTAAGTLHKGRVILGITDDPTTWARMVEPGWIRKSEQNGIQSLDGSLVLDVSGVGGAHYVIAAAAAEDYYEGWYADITVTRIACD